MVVSRKSTSKKTSSRKSSIPKRTSRKTSSKKSNFFNKGTVKKIGAAVAVAGVIGMGIGAKKLYDAHKLNKLLGELDLNDRLRLEHLIIEKINPFVSLGLSRKANDEEIKNKCKSLKTLGQADDDELLKVKTDIIACAALLNPKIRNYFSSYI